MKRILVIEDEVSLRENIAEALELENFHVICAENGQQGIEIAQAHWFDLILCDVMMPQVDGYGVLAQVRSFPGRAITPFIFLTAKASKLDVRQGMELGADDYLTKPFTHRELLSAVKARLEKQLVVQSLYQQQFDNLRKNISSSLPHELLTPLNGIVGLSDYLKSYANTIDANEILELANLISKSGWRFERVVQNTLTYTKLCIDASNGKSSNLSVKVCDTPQSVIESTAIAVTQKHQRSADLRLELSNSSVLIPETNLQKIVEELVDNACKFSTLGTEVSVNSTIKDNWFILTVTDRGRGITPEQITQIGAYVQFDRKHFEQQGLGLGLAIVRQLAEMYGGYFEVTSELEETSVRVMLPTKAE